MNIFYNGHETELNSATVPLNEHRKNICDFVKRTLFLINRHEADLNCVTAPQKNRNFDKYRAEGAKPTLILNGIFNLMTTNRSLILPYAAPYFAYILIGTVFKNHISVENNYLIRLIVVSLLIFWSWKKYPAIKGPGSTSVSVLVGIITGFTGLLIWVVLLSPFVDVNNSNAPWSDYAFFLRLICAGFLVPVFEELLTRGFILRLAFQWDTARKKGHKGPLLYVLDEKSVNDVEPGAWSWVAIIISTVAFTSGHHVEEWLAAVAFSILMVLLWIIRKDLISCIVAHAVTNISLAVYILMTGKWYLW